MSIFEMIMTIIATCAVVLGRYDIATLIWAIIAACVAEDVRDRVDRIEENQHEKN